MVVGEGQVTLKRGGHQDRIVSNDHCVYDWNEADVSTMDKKLRSRSCLSQVMIVPPTPNVLKAAFTSLGGRASWQTGTRTCLKGGRGRGE